MSKEFKLCPSVLSADFSMLEKQIKELESAGVPYLHLDVMDGAFVPNITFGPIVIAGIRKMTDMVLDTHLMIQQPERYIKNFAEAGSDIITFHIEATDRAEECIDLIHSFGCRAGLTLKPATPFSYITPYLEKLDMILIMSVEPGFGGQSFIEGSIDKIKAAANVFGGDIEVDGGVKCENVRRITEAGANVIVAGSAVFGSDISGNIAKICNAVNMS